MGSRPGGHPGELLWEKLANPREVERVHGVVSVEWSFVVLGKVATGMHSKVSSEYVTAYGIVEHSSDCQRAPTESSALKVGKKEKEVGARSKMGLPDHADIYMERQHSTHPDYISSRRMLRNRVF